MDLKNAIAKCQNAVLSIGLSHPMFLLLHAKIKNQYKELGNSEGLMAVTEDGSIHINPGFVERTDRETLSGVLCHEMLHLILRCFDRNKNKDKWVWNVAHDMAINSALRVDGIKLPEFVVYPPEEYKGDLFGEAIYEWLLKNPEKVPPCPQKNATPCNGCSLEESGDETTSDQQAKEWRRIGLEAKAMSQQAGRGNGGVSRLLTLRPPKISWKKVLRYGVNKAVSAYRRDYQTFAVRNRRSPATGPQFPGWRGFNLKIAVSVDVSGSMSPRCIEAIVSELKYLLKQFPDVGFYLNAHTDRVEWSGKITRGAQGKIDDSVQFSGGTDPNPAYEDISAHGGFDHLIHFTDTMFGSEVWPQIPAKHLVVGVCGSQVYCKPPAGSTVILCDFEI